MRTEQCFSLFLFLQTDLCFDVGGACRWAGVEIADHDVTTWPVWVQQGETYRSDKADSIKTSPIAIVVHLVINIYVFRVLWSKLWHVIVCVEIMGWKEEKFNLKRCFHSLCLCWSFVTARQSLEFFSSVFFLSSSSSSFSSSFSSSVHTGNFGDGASQLWWWWWCKEVEPGGSSYGRNEDVMTTQSHTPFSSNTHTRTHTPTHTHTLRSETSNQRCLCVCVCMIRVT